MSNDLQGLIEKYKSDQESVFNTWFINNDDRLKAFRFIRRGVSDVIQDIKTGTFGNDFKGSSLEFVLNCITEQKQVFIGAAHAFYWKPKLRIPDIYENDENVRREVESLGVSFDTMRQEVERMMATADPAATDGRLRQIYFPAGEGTYHLLTVLPSSSLLQVLNGRSRNMRQHRFDCRNEKSEFYGNACDEIMERTVIGFGGTKAQNAHTGRCCSPIPSENAGFACSPPWRNCPC